MDQQDRERIGRWEQDWAIRKKNRRLIIVCVAVLVIGLLVLLVSAGAMMLTRTTYSSEEEMSKAVEGCYLYEDFIMIVIFDGQVELTYFNSWDDTGDSVFNDTVKKWNYRTGTIKMNWMDDITIDKDGNPVFSGRTYRKVDPSEVPDRSAATNEEEEV